MLRSGFKGELQNADPKDRNDVIQKTENARFPYRFISHSESMGAKLFARKYGKLEANWTLTPGQWKRDDAGYYHLEVQFLRNERVIVPCTFSLSHLF
jgi:hypothetical protein